MISRNAARELFASYSRVLREFFRSIKEAEKPLKLPLDKDLIMVTLGALEAIQNDQKTYYRINRNNGIEDLTNFSDDPQLALEEIYSKKYYQNHFKKMYTHYITNTFSLEEIKCFLTEMVWTIQAMQTNKKIEIRKLITEDITSDNAMKLALTFPNTLMLNNFVHTLGEQEYFPENDEHLPNQPGYIASELKPILYVAAYPAKKGELGVAFPSEQMRDNFKRLFLHAPRITVPTHHAPINTVSTHLDNPLSIYFNNPKLHELSYSFNLLAPAEISSSPYTALAECKYYVAMLSQARRNSKLFKFLPPDVCAHITVFSININLMNLPIVCASTLKKDIFNMAHNGFKPKAPKKNVQMFFKNLTPKKEKEIILSPALASFFK
jgi:hypothetical protein